MSDDWCEHPKVLRRWEKGPKIRDEKDRQGCVVTIWYQWYQICGICDQTLRFEAREEGMDAGAGRTG